MDDIPDQAGELGPSRPVSNPSEERGRSLVFQTSGETIGTGTVTSAQQGTRLDNGRRAESAASKLDEHDAAISVLIGADNVQDYEEFLQTWAVHEKPSEKLLGDEARKPSVAVASKGRSASPKNSRPFASLETSIRPAVHSEVELCTIAYQ